jgi:hypothetical protein
LSSDLQTQVNAAKPNATVDIIVQYVSKPGDTQFAKVLRLELPPPFLVRGCGCPVLLTPEIDIRRAINTDQFSAAGRSILTIHKVRMREGSREEEASMDLSSLDIRLVGIAVVVVLCIVLAWLYMRRRKTAALRQKFGSEYNRAVLVHGSERKAEAKLVDREKRIEKLSIRELSPMEYERFAKRWEDVQSRFVDSPKGAVMEADDLVSSLMKTRGYPVADFEQRAADMSVDHPLMVENYRAAHETTMRVGRSEATTDELRGAMIHYRSLYEELMRVPPPVLLKMGA